MAANRPTRRKLIGTPKRKVLAASCEEFNILTAGPDLRQWAGAAFGLRASAKHFLGCAND
jgi:hypothetical protein